MRRWAADTDTVVYDFVDHVPSATVSLVTPDGPQACPWGPAGNHGGGLGRGPLEPAERFVCDPQRPWLWVAPTVTVDLDLLPRRCVWQHPAGKDPVRSTFTRVPLGEKLVLDAGLYYSSERKRELAPVTVRVLIDGKPSGELVHHDGDGWARTEIDTSQRKGHVATVSIETVTDRPFQRTLCWAATTRNGSPSK